MWELYSAPWCALDTFSRSIRQRWPDPAAILQNADFLAYLQLVLGHLTGNTFSTECLHSRSGRAAKQRYMTAKPSTSDLALPFPSLASPPVVCRKAKQAEAGATELGAKEGEGVSSDAVRRRKRGGGGPWRAFLQKELMELGAAGTSLHKSGSPSFPVTHKAGWKRRNHLGAAEFVDADGLCTHASLDTLRHHVLGLQETFSATNLSPSFPWFWEFLGLIISKVNNKQGISLVILVPLSILLFCCDSKKLENKRQFDKAFPRERT